MCEVECRVDDGDRICNVRGWSLGIPLSLWGLKKWQSPINFFLLSEDLNSHWKGDGWSRSSSLHTSREEHYGSSSLHLHTFTLAHLYTFWSWQIWIFLELFKTIEFSKNILDFWAKWFWVLLLVPLLLGNCFACCLTIEILSDISLEKMINDQLQGYRWLFFNLLGKSIEDKCVCSHWGLC